MKGRKLPEQQKKKISEANKGGNKTSFKKGSQIGKITQFKKGNKPWTTGKHIKVNDALKIWRANGGTLSMKHIEFLRKNFSGSNNPRWKGGITPENQRIRHSLEYKLWRTAVFMRDDYTCQSCFKKKEVSGKLEADHIKQFAYYPELRFVIDNGRTLCKDCHKNTSNYLVKGRWRKENECQIQKYQ